ncbi:unnamed protein product [Caenorhabditis auriculariae]|uniref:Uncharacterized protein n=1 Tax=Caenorhabditis auriculariae TaxID=2777116 RepID=A0A8S1HQI6_9PELO|nr:unnamed protein product [Caenorhabditis auriculariae]
MEAKKRTSREGCSSKAKKSDSETSNREGLSSFNSDSSIFSENPCHAFAPSFVLNDGDEKHAYRLQDGGKLIKVYRANGEVAYALICTDGRRVYIERKVDSACLVLSDPKGNVVKTLAAQY